MGINIEVSFKAADEIAATLKELVQEVKALNAGLANIEKAINPPEASRIVFFVEEGGKLIRVEGTMVKKVTETLKLKVKVTDRFGNDAKVDGLLSWGSTDDSLVDVVADEDGMGATVTPKGPVGSLKVQVHGDADLGEGVKDVAGEADLDLIAGDAELLSISEVIEAPPEP